MRRRRCVSPRDSDRGERRECSGRGPSRGVVPRGLREQKRGSSSTPPLMIDTRHSPQRLMARARRRGRRERADQARAGAVPSGHVHPSTPGVLERVSRLHCCAVMPCTTAPGQAVQGAALARVRSPAGIPARPSRAVCAQARRVRASAAVDKIAVPEIDEVPNAGGDDPDFCGMQGTVMDRTPIDGTGKRYHIHTFGCQMNLADSERMAGVLEALGYSCTTTAEEADVLVYNTCSIRDKAEQKVYSALGPQAKRKRERGTDLKVVVAGCVAQQEGEALARRVPEVDVVMGPQFANKIGDMLLRAETSQVVATEEVLVEEDITAPRRDSDLTAWVNVIYGCNEHCSYCVVPYTRGQEQSRRAEDIRAEMEGLGQAGYKEVTLLGQNVDAYGRDLPGMAEDGSGRRAWTFTDLLRYVSDVEGIERIRFATSHPRYFTERLIAACAELPKLCEFFHVPVQAGDNDILREMLRGYTHERYRRICDNIRRYMPDASISTDIIVGFPGETEEQYLRTEALIREVGFDRVNTAAYSPRPNTPAADRPDQVADLVKSDRLNRLNQVVLEVATERAQRFQDRVLEVLVEGRNPKNPEQMMGRSRHNKMVFFDGDMELRGQLVNVHIDECRAYSLMGHRTDAPCS
ncbi:unnamed protein product [Pedinophyceae sp. YPF-701]|nr:unnamed protein product [Pedinophyceae sp. YPF-701]